MRNDSENGGEHDHRQREKGAIKHRISTRNCQFHLLATSSSGNKSQNTKESRWKISPVRTRNEPMFHAPLSVRTAEVIQRASLVFYGFLPPSDDATKGW